MLVVAARLDHLETRIAHDVADAIALRRSQAEIAIHPFENRAAGRPQVMRAIRPVGRGEADKQTRDTDQCINPKIRLSWQDRSQSPAVQARADRRSLRNSRSHRAWTIRRARYRSAPARRNKRHCWRTERPLPQQRSRAIGAAPPRRVLPEQTAVDDHRARIHGDSRWRSRLPMARSLNATPAQ